MKDLRTVFPTEAELLSPWHLSGGEWWSAERRGARVYLNGGGTDDELRFVVFPPDYERIRYERWPPCDVCKGEGRVVRPAHPPGILTALFERKGREYDAADEDGKRRCDALNCNHGYTEPIYGASNSRMRLFDFDPVIARRCGARGLSNPTKDDVLYVIGWCDRALRRLGAVQRDERFP